MTPDLYEILEIPENANDVWIQRAFDLKKKAIAADATLSEQDRELKSIAVEKAFNTLSIPAARQRYDNRRVPTPVSEPALDVAGVSISPKWIVGAGSLLLSIAAVMYWRHTVTTERARLEREHAAEQQAAKLREFAQLEGAAHASSSTGTTPLESDEVRRESERRDAQISVTPTGVSGNSSRNATGAS